ncbi:MAG: AAA family ATPase, partial [Segetibacter sp.]
FFKGDLTNSEKSREEFLKLIATISVDDRMKLLKSLLKVQHDHLINERLKNNILSNFLVFSPENSSLRNFANEGQIEPLGIKGEGLFKLLKQIYQKDKKTFEKVINHLKLLEWFEDLQVPVSTFPGENYLKIKDKFFHESIEYLNQVSTNEGFLFLLFYIVLFISDSTPAFFSIDNIEASFNPRFCTKLTQTLVRLSFEHKKQVIVTTHNPFVLDGLDLENDEQRIFVVSRDLEGKTKIERIRAKKKSDLRISEAWMRGYFGGLPTNF